MRKLVGLCLSCSRVTQKGFSHDDTHLIVEYKYLYSIISETQQFYVSHWSIKTIYQLLCVHECSSWNDTFSAQARHTAQRKAFQSKEYNKYVKIYYIDNKYSKSK